MNYKQKIEELMVSEETLGEATKLFKNFFKKYDRLKKRTALEIFQEFLANGRMHLLPPIRIGQLIENEETLLQAHTLRTAAEAFLKTLPDDMEPLKELDNFVQTMDFCKGTLKISMGVARKGLAEMME